MDDSCDRPRAVLARRTIDRLFTIKLQTALLRRRLRRYGPPPAEVDERLNLIDQQTDEAAGLVDQLAEAGADLA